MFVIVSQTVLANGDNVMLRKYTVLIGSVLFF